MTFPARRGKGQCKLPGGLREIGVRSEYTDGRDMPRLLIESVQFEGPLVESWPPRTHTELLPPQLANEGERAYARRVLSNFATRAYRRPLTDDELAVLLRVCDSSRDAGQTLSQSLKDALQVTLASPQFLFLTKLVAGLNQSRSMNLNWLRSSHTFCGMAHRTSIRWIWRSKDACERSLDHEVTRLLADPRSDSFIRQFVSQWLALDKFQVLEPIDSSSPN